MSILAAIAIGVVVICWCIISTTKSIDQELAAIKQANERFYSQALEDLREMRIHLLDLSMKN
jgi:hypothetical protein